MRNTLVRRPAVAGMFYPADPDKLRAVAGGMLEEVNAAASRAIGAIVPHAGLIYSGQCAAHVWKRVSIPRILVVLAPNHTGALASPGASAWSQIHPRTRASMPSKSNCRSYSFWPRTSVWLRSSWRGIGGTTRSIWRPLSQLRRVSRKMTCCSSHPRT